MYVPGSRLERTSSYGVRVVGEGVQVRVSGGVVVGSGGCVKMYNVGVGEGMGGVIVICGVSERRGGCTVCERSGRFVEVAGGVPLLQPER
jgi:hypothetical protein